MKGIIMRSRLIALALALLAAAALALAVNHRSARAQTLTPPEGLTTADLAAQGISLSAPQGTPTTDAAQAEDAGRNAFSDPVIDATLAQCTFAQTDENTLCWIVSSAPSGKIAAFGPAGNPLEGRVVAVDYEFVVVDATAGTVIRAVQHAPTDTQQLPTS
jgi:hypothetical protein